MGGEARIVDGGGRGAGRVLTATPTGFDSPRLQFNANARPQRTGRWESLDVSIVARQQTEGKLRTDSPQWIATKAEGDRAELAIASWFRDKGWETYKTLGNVAFDLLLQCEVEVKRDLKAAETGNVAIEMAYRGQPSGILTSRATWWAIFIGGKALVVKTETLRRFVLSGRFREVSAGDNRLATVRLVPVEKLKDLKGVGIIDLSEQIQSAG